MLPLQLRLEKKSGFFACLYNFVVGDVDSTTSQISQAHGQSDPLMPQIKTELDQAKSHSDRDDRAKVIGQVLARHAPHMSVDLSPSQIEQIRAAMREQNEESYAFPGQRHKGIDSFIDTATFGKRISNR